MAFVRELFFFTEILGGFYLFLVRL